MTRRVTRITRELTAEEKKRLARNQKRVGQELPDLKLRDQMRKDAWDETTLSGGVRRAIHQSELSLSEIASQAGITPIMLDDFLTGERTLRSDVMDRVASVLRFRVGSETSQA